MSIAGQIIERGSRLRESIDAVRWLQSPDVPHNFHDPLATQMCPNLPKPTGINRLFKEHQNIQKLAPDDLFPITSMEPALSIGSSSPLATIDSVDPSSRHLLCYWRVHFIAPRRPLIIDGTLHTPQVPGPASVPSAKRREAHAL